MWSSELGDTFTFLVSGLGVSLGLRDASESLRLPGGDVEELSDVILLSVSIPVRREGVFSFILLAEDEATDALARGEREEEVSMEARCFLFIPELGPVA